MSRTLFGGLLAAALLLPATSFAAIPRDSTSDRPQVLTPNNSDQQFPRSLTNKPIDMSPGNPGPHSLGSGMVGGNDPGHIASPGNTPIDNDTRGPLNDVQPGAPGSSDPPQAAHPKPVR
jgi:hypothetical protein